MTHDPSNTVAAVSIIVIFAIACAVAMWPKQKKENVPRRPVGAEAKDYSKILDVIIKAERPRDLYKIFGMNQEFRVKYTGIIPESEINKYITDIIELKEKKANELLGKKITALNVLSC